MLTGREAGKANLLEGADDTRFPVYPQHLVTQVREAMPSDGIIALDNSVYKIWFARNYKAHIPNTVLLDNTLVTMGQGSFQPWRRGLSIRTGRSWPFVATMVS